MMMEPPNKRAKVDADAARSSEGEKFSYWELISTSPTVTVMSTQQSIANSAGGDDKFAKQTQLATHLESVGPIDVETIVTSLYNAETEQAVRDMLEAHRRTDSYIKILEAQKRTGQEWETKFGDFWTVKGTGNPNYLVLFTGSAHGKLVRKGAIVWAETPDEGHLLSFLVTRDVVKPIQKHAAWLDCYTLEEANFRADKGTPADLKDYLGQLMVVSDFYQRLRRYSSLTIHESPFPGSAEEIRLNVDGESLLPVRYRFWKKKGKRENFLPLKVLLRDREYRTLGIPGRTPLLEETSCTLRTKPLDRYGRSVDESKHGGSKHGKSLVMEDRISGPHRDQACTARLTWGAPPFGMQAGGSNFNCANRVQIHLQQEDPSPGNLGSAGRFRQDSWPRDDAGVEFHILHGDALMMSAALRQAREFSLMLVDVPRGLEVRNNNDARFSSNDVKALVHQFSRQTTATEWKIVVMHGLEDAGSVRDALHGVCNLGVEAAVWIKTNITGQSKVKLTDAVDYITIGHQCSTNLRNANIAGFFVDGANNPELRGKTGMTNVFEHCAVCRQLCFGGSSRKVANVYQKPVKLVRQLVRMYSKAGSWVLDMCCVSGTGAVSALLERRNVVAVDIDPRQVEVVKWRIRGLGLLPDEDQEISLHP